MRSSSAQEKHRQGSRRLSASCRTYSLDARRNRLFIRHTTTSHTIHLPSIPNILFLSTLFQLDHYFRMSLLASSSRLLRNHPGYTTILVPRTYATFTELPRPPPPSKQPEPITFSAPSRPRQYYARPQYKRDLPPIPVCLPLTSLLPLLIILSLFNPNSESGLYCWLWV